MTSKRGAWWRVLALLAALGIFAAACGSDSDSGDSASSTTETTQAESEEPDEPPATTDEANYGGSITIGMEAESNTWTPGEGNFASSGTTVALAIYDPLVSINAEGDFEGFLAESLEPNDDLTEWTLKLRPDIKFHDGSDLNAEVVKWNFDTLHNNDSRQTFGTLQIAGVTGMDIVDDLTVVYHLSETNAAFPDLLRGQIGWPVSKEAYEANPDGFGSHPVGTGPFEVVEWRRDDRMVTKRNENYWFTAANGDQLPYLDEVIFRPIPDEDSRVQSLAAGSVQMTQTLRGSAIKATQELERTGNIDVLLYAGNESNTAIFNMLVPPVDDVRVRKALVMATDSYTVQEVLGDDGLVNPSSGFFSPDSPWYSSKVADAYPTDGTRNVEGAKELIEEYRADPNRSDGRNPGDPIDVEYNCPPDPSLLQVAQLQQGFWAEINVNTKLNQVEQGPHIENAVGSADQEPPFKGNYMINCWRTGGGTGDPITSLQTYFGPIATTPGNVFNYVDPEIDEALHTLKTSADFTERYAAVEKIGIITSEQVPVLWVSPTATAIGYVNNIRGIDDWTLPSGKRGNGNPSAIIRTHQLFLAN